MLILGLNAYHADASACLISDGKIVAAAEEERFRRVKHWAGLPVQAVKYCLEEARAELSDVSVVAVNQDNRANTLKRLEYVFRTRPDVQSAYSRLRSRNERRNASAALGEALGVDTSHIKNEQVEHHLAHIASAQFWSGFDECVGVSMDGFGDFASAMWAHIENGKIDIQTRVFFPHSMGILYQAATQYLGFQNYGDEFKVMGLSAYGNPVYRPQFRRMVNYFGDGSFTLSTQFFTRETQQISFQWNDGTPSFAPLYSDFFESRFGPARKSSEPIEQKHRDFAASTQQIYEEVFFNLCSAARRMTGSDRVALSGGCINNSVANGKLLEASGFKQLGADPAPADCGGALGAALVAWHRHKASAVDHCTAYLGPGFTDEEIASAIDASKAQLAHERIHAIHLENATEITRRASELLSEGAILGWFQGRMEWGPRALGNRSILCDPRREDARDMINAKIKMRESFRPFAPSVLAEKIVDWFEDDRPSPYMSEVRTVREAKRAEIPAVVHYDGSARVHTVSKSENSLFYELLSAFEAITDIPILLNTSLNENEPIVLTPSEAIDIMIRTSMDAIVLGAFLLVRNPESALNGD